jgi:hypothetical protein
MDTQERAKTNTNVHGLRVLRETVRILREMRLAWSLLNRSACPHKTIIGIRRALLKPIRHIASKVVRALIIFLLTLEVVMAQKLPFHPGFKHAGSSAEPALIAVCCVCGLVRARKTFTGESDRWITCRAYEHRYGVALMSSTLTHTYCSGCYTDFMQRVRHTPQATAPLPR